MSQEIKRIVLARHVDGMPKRDDFRLESVPLPALRDGQFLLRVFFVSLDPGTRSRLSPGPSYTVPLELGQVVGAFNMGEVIESRHPDYGPGDVLTTAARWQDYVVSDGRGYLAKIGDIRLPYSLWIGILGVPGMTAYFGLKRVAGLRETDTVLVTSASGPVGATAGQIAKIEGCKVVGVAGGGHKCGWIVDEAGFDAAIDYRSETDLAGAIRGHCPDGIDVLFDNIGNEMVDRVLPMMVSVRSGRGMGPVKRISHVEARPHKVLSFCW